MAQRSDRSGRLRDRSFLIACAVGGVLLVVLVIAVVSLISPSGAGKAQKVAGPAPPAVATPTVPIPSESPPSDPALVPLSTTYTTINGAPLDSTPSDGAADAADGVVVHPRREIFVYDAPGGAAIARLGPHQLGDTWVPVVAQQPGWGRVLLPSRPNGSTGWGTDTAPGRAYTP